MNLRKYITLTRANIMEALQFRFGILVIMAGNMLYLIVVYFLWKAIYDSSETDIVNDMTFFDTLIYVVLATALFNFMETGTVWKIGRHVQSGQIVLDLLKPMKYRSYLFWSFSGEILTNFFLTFLPTFIVVAALTHGAIYIGANLIFFFISVVIAIILNYSIDFIVGTICLYTESIWGINIMKQVIVLLFSGVTIPLAFFPDAFRTVADHLPFQSIYNAPLSILLDANPEPQNLIHILGVQLIWCIIMTVISILFWNISMRRITVNGG